MSDQAQQEVSIDTPAADQIDPREQRRSEAAERARIRKANLSSVFGSGIGKVALILGGIAIAVFGVLAVKGLSGAPSRENIAKTDSPNAPRVSRAELRDLDDKEQARRAAIAASESMAAAQKDASYQPEFTGNLRTTGPMAPGVNQPPLPLGAVRNNRERDAMYGTTLPTASAPAGQTPSTITESQQAAQPVTIAGRPTAAPAPIDQQRVADDRAADKAYVDELKRRDKYRDDIQQTTLARMEELLGQGGALRAKTGFSTVGYYQTQTAAAPSGAAGNTAQGAAKTAKKTPLIFKAGNVIYATLDAEVNTDDGGAVFATVRGGKWDGAKLIGRIEQSPDNIRLTFTTLTTQDDQRPSITISALAIREVDAKQGVAETKDRHLLERYGSLIFASVLSGVGKAAAMPTGSTVTYPNGTTVTETDPVTGKRLAYIAAGEAGTAAAAEIRQGFSRPATYIVPANQGIGVIFLSDVNDNEAK